MKRAQSTQQLQLNVKWFSFKTRKLKIKMAIRQARIFFLLLFVGEIVSSAIGIESAKFNTEKSIRTDLFYMRNFNISNAIDGILSQKWTENHECLAELNAIKTGLKNHEEWAIRGITPWILIVNKM